MRFRTHVLLASVCLVTAAGCSKAGSDKAGPAPRAGATLDIAVTEKGFEPADLKVVKGQPVTLVFERKTDATCAKQVVIHVDDKQTIQKELPLNQRVAVETTFPASGDLTYACGMDMIKGVIHVQERD